MLRGATNIHVPSVALALSVALTLASCGGRYVVPTGVVGDRYSPPSLQGRVTAVAPEQLTVTSDEGDVTMMVQISPETRLLKLNEGLVLRQELMVGHRVRVWFDSPNATNGSDVRPARVVMLASLDPRDDWPKD